MTPSMRFVGVRSLENQAALMRHKAREMLVSSANAIAERLARPLRPRSALSRRKGRDTPANWPS